jgi:dihydrofolate reductase
MKLSLIAAMDIHRVIGNKNQLPWHLPADLKHFKAITMGKPIVMGRKTFESIGKALPGRENIVISHNPAFNAPGCLVQTSLEQALDHLKQENEIMIIGGAILFQKALPIAHRMYLTLIQHQFEGDAFFPAWDTQEWQEVSREDHAPDEQNPYPFSFIVLESI